MYNIIQKAKNFKIIPNNFRSSGAFEVVNLDEDKMDVKLILSEDNDKKDYIPGENVEVFGVYEVGLIYFETKIIDRKDDIVTLNLTQDYSIIQRREYSRVGLEHGKILFKDLSPDLVLKIDDISAGGLKILTNQPLELDKHYSIQISLSNNMNIECALQPIRIKELGDKTYSISGKFVDLENVDRIVLVQYAFKIKMEEQSKENR